jgi:hypothetical protein
MDEERQSRVQHSNHCRCNLTIVAALRVILATPVGANPFTAVTATPNRFLASKRKRQQQWGWSVITMKTFISIHTRIYVTSATSTLLPQSPASHISTAENTMCPNVFFVSSLIYRPVLGFVLGLWSSQFEFVVLLWFYFLFVPGFIFESSS